MELNPIGVAAALSTFVGVWLGHVAVRKVESVSPTIWIPTTIFAAVGVALEGLSLTTPSPSLSTSFGILGITFLWDAIEFTRQQKRVKNGHAPANPNNPRHVQLLRAYSSVTTLDLLKREPIGKLVSYHEAIDLIAEH